MQPYLSLEAELHDAFWLAEDDGSELRMMAEFLTNHPGPALEIGSGSGRLLLPLAEQGFDIDGLELSSDMLAIARKQAAEQKRPVTMHRGDMSSWSADKTYNSLLAPAFTLQLATDPAATLAHWRSLLNPGGALYITTFIPYAEILGELPANQWYPDHQAFHSDGTEARLETRHTIDHANQTLTRRHRYTILGKQTRRHQSTQTIRWFEHDQMLALLTRTGFETQSHILDFDPETAGQSPDPAESDGIVTYQAVLPRQRD